MKKTILILGIIFMLVDISLNPTIAVFNSNDDTTPPVTAISLNPPEPDGENGWYVSDVNVTLIAIDDISGVNVTYYRINNGEWEVYNSTFVISEDGDDILIEYYSVDNADNQESIKQISIDMDQTNPLVDLWFVWEIIDEENDTYLFEFTATANDKTSGMNRTEFYLNDILQKTVYGLGPDYVWEMIVDYNYSVRGFIIKGIVKEEYVKFFAIAVFTDFYSDYCHPLDIYEAYAYDNAGNYKIDGIYPPGSLLQLLDLNHLKWYTFSNDYEGHIGKFYIDAIFEKRPIAVSIVPNILNFEPNNLFLKFLDHFPLLQRLLEFWRLNLL